jgi:NADH dehydrogenase
MILVVGSTGILGSEICRRLTASGKPVRGLVRSSSSPEKVDRLKAMGVETVLGDLRDPHSLAAACQGADTVITTATTTISMQPGDSIPVTDQQGQLDLVQAARQAGVRKFVFVSIPQGMEPCPLTTAKRTVEKALMSSGMDYTILCPGIFMEIWLSPALGFDYPNAKATIYGDGHSRNSFISVGDVAEYAVQSLDNPAASNGWFEMGYPETHSFLEVVRAFERAGGKSFELQFVPAVALEAQREAATDPLQKSFASMMHNLATGIRLDPASAQKAFPDIELKSVKDYVSQDVLIIFPRPV